jgi:hypothetical protein
MFPAGLPGVALLLLRASAAISLLLNCYGHRNELAGWEQAAALLIASSLCAGYLTPILALTGIIFHCLLWWQLDGVGIAFMVIVTLDAIALVLLGPGAYSADAYRFGRRLVVLPPP